VPLDPATVAAADQGIPVVFLEGDFPAKQGFLELADNIAKRATSSLEALAGNHS
jgi:ABC-type sugar transport system substrate-binding protein